MAWLGLVFYGLGLMGYNATYRRLGVSPYLSWLTDMLTQILLLYVFAMLGWLNLGIWVVTLLGIGMLVTWTVLGRLG